MIEEYRRTRYDDEGEQPVDWCRFGLVLMVVLMILGFLTGCKTTKPVTQTAPTIMTQYIVKSDTFLEKDSVYLHDSIYVYHNGDTVIVNKVMRRDRWKNVYRTVLDTIVKRDSIPYPVEKELTKMQQRYLKVGGWICGSLPWVLAILSLVGIGVWHEKKSK